MNHTSLASAKAEIETLREQVDALRQTEEQLREEIADLEDENHSLDSQLAGCVIRSVEWASTLRRSASYVNDPLLRYDLEQLAELFYKGVNV